MSGVLASRMKCRLEYNAPPDEKRKEGDSHSTRSSVRLQCCKLIIISIVKISLSRLFRPRLWKSITRNTIKPTSQISSLQKKRCMKPSKRRMSPLRLLCSLRLDSTEVDTLTTGNQINSILISSSIFWKNLAPASEGGIEGPKGQLLAAITKEFGSFDAFSKPKLFNILSKESKFIAQAAGVQGSGWAWLALNPANKRMEIVALPNQDPLIGHIPLLGVDVWEHVIL